MAPTGRYQSRVLSFLSQRSRQWIDQCEIALRHAKVATLWGVQVILSPLYLMRQGGWRRLGQPLGGGSAASVGLPEATEASPSPMTSQEEGPVLGVLQGMERWRSLDSGRSKLSGDSALVLGSQGAIAPQVAVVRGIASCLVSRELMLVSADNQGLEGLTPFEQRLLKQQIWLAIALFEGNQLIRPHLQNMVVALQEAWRPLGQQISQWTAGRRFGGPVPVGAIAPYESVEGSGLVLGPVPGAIAPVAQPVGLLDRVGKSALVVRQHLEKAIARVRSPLQPAVNQDQAFREQASSASGAGALSSMGAIAPYGGLTASGPTETVSSLLRAAVAYFFGDRAPQPRLLGGEPTLPTAIPPRSLLGQVWQAIAPSPFAPRQVPTLTLDDPWLTAEDLFGVQSSPVVPPAAPVPVLLALPESPQITLPSSIRHWLRRVSLGSPASLISQPDFPPPVLNLPEIRKVGHRLTPQTRERSAQSLAVAESASLSSPGTSPSTEAGSSSSFDHWLAALGDLGLTPNHDWIEASATPTGYVKHPLERLLEWFDRLLVWLEEWIIAVFRWLTRFWKP